jgi:uncharacterized protein (DUF1778 family)
MARPFKEPGERKDVDLRIPVTAEQKELVAQAAKKAGADMAAWVRPLILAEAARVLAKPPAVRGARTPKSARRDAS